MSNLSTFPCLIDLGELGLDSRGNEVFHAMMGQLAVGALVAGDYPDKDWAQELISRTHCYAYLAARQKSPIEKIMCAILAAGNDGYQRVMSTREFDEHGTAAWGCYVEPQFKISLQKNYVVDFLIRVITSRGNERFVVVECDGHDFHERTKQQAANDRSRDRDLISNGYTVLRYTGSELYRSPYKIGDELAVILSDIVFDGVL